MRDRELREDVQRLGETCLRLVWDGEHQVTGDLPEARICGILHGTAAVRGCVASAEETERLVR